MNRILLVLSALVLLSACSVQGVDQSGTAESTTNVTASDFGEAWPLTVSSGTIRYRKPSVVTFSHGGVEYALNGMATSRGYAAIEPIWTANPRAKRRALRRRLSKTG